MSLIVKNCETIFDEIDETPSLHRESVSFEIKFWDPPAPKIRVKAEVPNSELVLVYWEQICVCAPWIWCWKSASKSGQQSEKFLRCVHFSDSNEMNENEPVRCSNLEAPLRRNRISEKLTRPKFLLQRKFLWKIYFAFMPIWRLRHFVASLLSIEDGSGKNICNFLGTFFFLAENLLLLVDSIMWGKYKVLNSSLPKFQVALMFCIGFFNRNLHLIKVPVKYDLKWRWGVNLERA